MIVISLAPVVPSDVIPQIRFWEGVTVIDVAGRPNITTPADDAVRIVGKNIRLLVDGITDRTEVTLTGAAPVWAYLVAFHAVVHAFTRVYYNDGRNPTVLVAAHG